MSTFLGLSTHTIRYRIAPITISLALCLLALVLITPSSYELLRTPDIGSQLTKGLQILSNRHPHLDIVNSVYGIGIFYISALGQALAPDRVLPEIIIIFSGYILAFWLLFRAFIKFANKPWLLLILAALCAIAFPRFHKYYIVLTPALYLFALSWNAFAPLTFRNGFLLGLIVVAMALFRVDYAAYAFATSLVYYGTRHIVLTRENAIPSMIGFLAACLFAGLCFLGTLYIFGDLPAIIRESFLSAGGAISGLSTPLPLYDLETPIFSPGNRLFLSFLALAAIPYLGIFYAISRHIIWKNITASPQSRWRLRKYCPPPAPELMPDLYLFIASLFAALVFLQASHRIDMSHLRQVFPPIAFVACLLLDRWISSSRERSLLHWVALTSTIVIAIFLGKLLINPKLTYEYTYNLSRLHSRLVSLALSNEQLLANATARGQITRQTDTAFAINHIRSLTTENDTVLFLPFQAQAYFFAHRLFSPRFGWWHPGRFLPENSEQAYIQSMASTEFVVDMPVFSFDNMPSRNARTFAPTVMEYIYSSFGILEVINNYVILTKNHRVLQKHAVFPYRFLKYDNIDYRIRTATSHGGITKTDRPCNAGYSLHSINTLPAPDFSATRKMLHGSGLLLNIEQCELMDEETCAAVALKGQSGLYLPEGPNGLVLANALDGHTPIGTHTVPPGLYDIVLVKGRNCETIDQRRHVQPKLELIPLEYRLNIYFDIDSTAKEGSPTNHP